MKLSASFGRSDRYRKYSLHWCFNIELILLGVTSTRETETRKISQCITIVIYLVKSKEDEGKRVDAPNRSYSQGNFSQVIFKYGITELAISRHSRDFWSREGSKNNLRRISLGIRPIEGINSLTLNPLLVRWFWCKN